MFIARLIQAACLAVLSVGQSFAIEIIPFTGRFAIGSIGVYCFTEPCPWRGIVELENSKRDPLRPLWTGDTLPTLLANGKDKVRIAKAWNAWQCLVVDGTFSDDAADIGGPPFLRVNQILGEC